MKKILTIVALLVFSALTAHAATAKYVQQKPLSSVLKVSKKAVSDDTVLPMITWGADTAIIKANGDSVRTIKGSAFDKAGLKLFLQREDNFLTQVKNYKQGKTAYLRGTVGMINLASDILNDPDLKPVVFTQLSWSNGGDALVVRGKMTKLSQLKGKTIVLQAYGPHIDMLAEVLKTAGLKISDVKIKYVKDLTGTQNSDPAAAMRLDKSVDAAFMIIPDALTLTSNGAVGTGAEGSVKGAKILFSTKTANRVIADVIAVRSDYFKTHKVQVEKLAHAILVSQAAVTADYKANNKKVISKHAKLLLDAKDATDDMSGLFADMKFADIAMNKQFLDDINYPRNLTVLARSTAKSFKQSGLIKGKSSIINPSLDWAVVSNGLKSVKTKQTYNTSAIISKKQKQGTLSSDAIYAFKVFFKPNQQDFPVSLYQEDFDKVISMASSFGGALITIEGHSDNLKFLKAKKRGASAVELKRLRQSAKNLSLSRANAALKAIITYAKGKGVFLDPNQFGLIGWGVENPTYNPPKSKQQWLDNMNVEFKLIQVEAEASEFEAL